MPPDPRFPVSSESLTAMPSRPDAALAAPEETAGEALRPSTPVCPRCDISLEGAKHTTGIAWRCRSCGGQSLNFSQFRRMVPEAHVDEIWVTTTARPVSAPRRTRCPECRRHMTAVLVPAQDREIELDVCRRCQRLWLGNQEKLCRTLDTAPQGKKPHSPGAPKPPVIRLAGGPADDQAHQDFQENMLRARMLTRREPRPNLHRPILTAVLVVLMLVWLVLKRH